MPLGNRLQRGSAVCSLVLVLAPIRALEAQTRPVVDHHQHLFNPATVALVSPAPLRPVALPPALDSLLEARIRSSRDAAALRALYTDDAWLVQPSGLTRGPDSVAAALLRSNPVPYRLTPVGFSITDNAGYLTTAITEDLEPPRNLGQVLLVVRKGPDARWRISAESRSAPPVAVTPILARDLIGLLDQAGIRRAIVLSMAYTWASPSRFVENEYEKVKAENDWTSRQVGQFPERLRGFCSFNPLRGYALEELARCADDPYLHYGLKLHFGNSAVDLSDMLHVDQVRQVFRAANERRMPIIVHMRASISRGLPYGREQAEIFLNQLLPVVPNVPVQIAHLAGAGGYDAKTDEALSVFAEAIRKRDPHTRRLYFDVSGVVFPFLDLPADRAELIATRLRQIGLDRVLFGSDAATGGNLPPRQAWTVFHQLPLTDAEFRTIANNVAPFARW
jgi:predicted TIM-barrel fold metal-dependent hydrolase